MEYNPSISLIIPCLNSENCIKRCLDSVIELDYPRDMLNIFVVDNGSTDRTAEVLSSYRVNYLYMNDRGRAKARNYGVSKSTSEYVAFVDSDCILPRDWLRRMIKCFTISPTIAVVQSGIIPIPLFNRTWLADYVSWKYNQATFGNFNTIDRPCPRLPKLDSAGILLPRKKFNDSGGFDERFDRYEDRELGRRILLSGKAIFCCDVKLDKICNNKSWMKYFLDVGLDTKGEILSFYLHSETHKSLLRILSAKMRLFYNDWKTTFYFQNLKMKLIEVFEYFFYFLFYIYFFIRLNPNNRKDRSCEHSYSELKSKRVNWGDGEIEIVFNNPLMHYITSDKVVIFDLSGKRCTLTNHDLKQFWLRFLSKNEGLILNENELNFLKGLIVLGVSIKNVDNL